MQQILMKKHISAIYVGEFSSCNATTYGKAIKTISRFDLILICLLVVGLNKFSETRAPLRKGRKIFPVLYALESFLFDAVRVKD
jgi:hypothetical protein